LEGGCLKNYDPHGFLSHTNDELGLAPAKYIIDLERAQHNAAKEQLTVLTATDTMLLLDYDTEEQYSEFLNTWGPRLVTHFGVKRILVSESKSGNKHVYVHLYQPLPAFARIALQAVLGSDIKREFMNMIRELQMKDGQGILLFETLKHEPQVIYATDGYTPVLSVPEVQKMLMAGE
jgi:hypothetical protein